MRLNILVLVMVYALTSLRVSGQEAVGSEFDYNSYKEAVVNYSKEITKSSEQKKAMVEAVKYAKTNFFPRIDFASSAQYQFTTSNISIGDLSMTLPSDSYSLGATLSQVIYNGGAVSNSYKAAIIKDSIASVSEELTLQNILYAAEVNYWNAVAQRSLYKAITYYVETVQSLANVLKERYEDGLIARTDYLQTLTSLKDAEITKSNTYKQYQLSLQNLNILMGRDPMAPVELLNSIDTELPAAEYMGLQEVLARRADYRISELNVDYEHKQLKVIQSQFNPQLSVGVKQSWGTQAINFDGTTKFNTLAYASLKFPIFAWGGRYKKSNSQKAIIRTKELDTQITSDNISKEVANAWTSYTESTKQLKPALESSKISKESMELNTFSYTEGKLPILDVLTSQIKWIQAQTTYISTLLNQKSSRAAYLKAVNSL